MLCVGVAACHGYGMCTVHCVEFDCMVCVLFAVLSATHTQHSEQYTYHTYDMLPHHCVTCNDVVF